MGDDRLGKFSLTAEHRRIIKEAFNELMDRQFEAMESSYADIFRGLPEGVAESMSPQEAARLVDMVVRAAADNIAAGAKAVCGEVANVAKDEARMEGIRKSFMEGMSPKETRE